LFSKSQLLGIGPIKSTTLFFVTNNSKDFLKFAVIYDIGIVATENIKSKNPEDLAEMISDAIIDYSLWGQKSGFILTLMSDGKHQFKILTD